MKPLRLVQVVGARPQFIKLAPLSRAIRECRERPIEELIVHTGQHYDPQLSEVFFEELDIPQPSANLEVGSGSHGQQTAAILERVEAYLLDTRPDAVVVYGDTNSTLAGALAAVKLQVPVAHIEAGLRSRNRAMPEELNRVATDHLSDLLLAPTDTAMRNLAAEGLAARSCLVGDVMYDALLANAALARRRSRILDTLGIAARRYGLVTIHRAESTQEAALPAVLELLAGIARSLVPLVFPVHPRTREAMRNIVPDWQPPPELVLTNPVGPLDMLRLTEAAAVVLTDSGGLQKEAFMLGCPCVTLRSETEWVETVAAQANTVVGHDPGAAAAAVRRALAQVATGNTDAAPRVHALYGQGDAAVRCLGQILKLADGARRVNAP
jgi:UDP-N-acetylglucosamine 2-epimerase